ncbi:MAG: T9SS type A sorting domain-containing protein [Bacteroidia bacterium]|nr:T9SS type A sorting domain-containing protein [Bacteroidia bacterium]
MKKQLLIGTALLAAVSAYPQNGRIRQKPTAIANMAQNVADKFMNDPIRVSSPATNKGVETLQDQTSKTSEESSIAMPPSTISWKLLCGSMNIAGMLVTQSRPLQYNNNVNSVSFVHRKSASYTALPALPATAQSGAIVAEISTNWGTTWDSTCIWADATNWGRYPQGGVYSPVGNSSIGSAYIVGSGPTVAGSTWTGNFYASKQLNAFNNTASGAPNAQQMLSFTLPSYPPNLGPHGWSRQGFTYTDDGMIRSLGLIQNDNTGLSTMRGVAVVKGAFNAGAFTWTSDSIVPATIITTAGGKALGSAPQMVWNESGTVGYVVMLGAVSTAVNSNKGYQPIVYKTTNSGVSWAQLTGIDFNAPAMAPLLDHIATVNANTNIAVPYFIDYDATVDANNKLHIGATFRSAASNHNDSLTYYSQFTKNVDLYAWGHTPGNRPYLYDFIGDGTAAWMVKTVDSLSSEAASGTTGQPGFNENPWNASSTSEPVKVDNCGQRIQLGRTPDGQYVTFSWSESDTNFTNGARNYNSLPNIKARCMAVSSGTAPYTISPTEINVSKVAAGTGTNNPNVSSRATLYYMSPTTGAASVVSNTVDIQTPYTVTNSNPFDPLLNNTTWYQQGKLSYSFSSITTGISQAQTSVGNSFIYPNPASNNATLVIGLKDNLSVDIAVLNAIGQTVKSSKTQGQVGENSINVDLTGLSTGIYMVNIKVGNASSTKKLVVQ